MPALNLGGHWPSSSVGADMIHPWSSLASSAAGAAAEWQQDKGQKSPTWSQDAGTVWNADSPSEKHHRDEKVSSLIGIAVYMVVILILEIHRLPWWICKLELCFNIVTSAAILELGQWLEGAAILKVSSIFQQSQGISHWFLILMFLDKKGHTLLLLDGADL